MPDVSSIINMARTRIAAEAAKSTAAAEVAEGASEKAESEIRQKIRELNGQISELHELLERSRMCPPGIEGSWRPLLGRLPILPRALSVAGMRGSRKGWSIAEVNFTMRSRGWMAVTSEIGGARQDPSTTVGRKGIVLLTDGSLHEYYWLKPSPRILVSDPYDRESDLPPEFAASRGSAFDRWLSELPKQAVNSQRWAASLETNMVALAEAALRRDQLESSSQSVSPPQGDII